MFLNILVELGINEFEDTSNNNAQHRSALKLLVYKESFQNGFIESTQNYYKQESAEFLQANTVTEYLKKVKYLFYIYFVFLI